MPSIVNTTFYANPTGITSATVTIPATTAGNTLVICCAGQPAEPGGFGGMTITLSGGQVFTDSLDDGNTSPGPAHVCTDIQWLTNIAGGKTSLSFTTGGAGPAMWIYEITPAVADVFGISNLDDGGSPGTMAGIVGPSLTPSASAIYFTVAEGGNYYVQVDITAVNSPWTIDSHIIHHSGGVSSYSPTAACATFIGTGPQQATFTPGTDPGGFGNYVTNAQTFIDAIVAPAPTVTSVTAPSGTVNGGTPVTVTGTNFVAGATVTFGGNAATSVVFVNSTTLTCVTPAHANGAVTVAVTNPDTQSGSLVAGYTYLAIVVTPSSLSFVNSVFGFSPAIGDGQAGDGTTYAQTLNITASGAWTVTSDSWFLCASSGSGNGTVTVQLLGTGLPQDSFGRIKSTANLKTYPFSDTPYSGTISVTNGVTTVDVPVTYRVGYGNQLGG